jgi:hypothetical protein
MAKFCNNGHQMEDSWTDCPYCVKTGYRSVGLAADDKTRPEMSVLVPQDKPENKPEFDGGKTVLLASIKRPPVVGWLVVLNGAQKGEDFRLHEGKNGLGTARDCEVVLRDPAVSNKHASVSYKESKFMLTDLDSTNGTFVNDSAEGVARIELKDNDIIRLGETTLKFKCL